MKEGKERLMARACPLLAAEVSSLCGGTHSSQHPGLDQLQQEEGLLLPHPERPVTPSLRPAGDRTCGSAPPVSDLQACSARDYSCLSL